MPPEGYADPITNNGPGFHSDVRIFYSGTLVRSSPNLSLEPSKQVTPAQLLCTRRPRMGPPKRVYMHTIIVRLPSLMAKVQQVGTPRLRSEKPTDPSPRPDSRSVAANTVRSGVKYALFLVNKYYKVQLANGRYKVQNQLPPLRW
jgi:hypothetical protein